MSKSLCFSLIIPTYNAAGSLARALESIRQQSHRPSEVIVVDGASKDGTAELARRHDDVVTRVISEPDRGQAHAINKGFALATGDCLGWLCADDELLPQAIEHAANHFFADPTLDIFSGACQRLYEDGSIQIVTPPKNAFAIIGAQYRIEQPSTFWRRRVQRDLLLDESFHFAFDWDFFAKITRHAQNTLVVRDVMSKYHFSPHNKTSTGGRRLVQEMYRVVKLHGPLEGHLARIFDFLYRRFDLAGCYDTPTAAPARIQARFNRVLAGLERRYGRELIHLYNWNFASKQERKMIWYK